MTYNDYGQPSDTLGSPSLSEWAADVAAAINALETATPPTGGAAWGTVTLWADLPLTGNVLGQKIRVTSGLGLCVALWTGTAWTVAPESDTGWRTWTPINGWTAVAPAVRRIGARVQVEALLVGATRTDNIVWVMPPGFVPAETGSGALFRLADPAAIPYDRAVTRNLRVWPVDTLGTGISASISWLTPDPWPTTPPA